MGLTDQCEFITDMTHLKQHTHTRANARLSPPGAVPDAYNKHTLARLHRNGFACTQTASLGSLNTLKLTHPAVC